MGTKNKDIVVIRRQLTEAKRKVVSLQICSRSKSKTITNLRAKIRRCQREQLTVAKVNKIKILEERLAVTRKGIFKDKRRIAKDRYEQGYKDAMRSCISRPSYVVESANIFLIFNAIRANTGLSSKSISILLFGYRMKDFTAGDIINITDNLTRATIKRNLWVLKKQNLVTQAGEVRWCLTGEGIQLMDKIMKYLTEKIKWIPHQA